MIPEVVGTLSDGAHMGGGSTGRTPTQAASLPSVSLCLTAGGMGRIDAESETLIPIGGFFDVAIPIQNATRGEDQNGLGVGGDVMFTLDQASQHAVAHSLRGEGFNASEDGTGRGTPLVAIPQVSGPILSHRRGVPSSDEVAQGHLVAQTLTSGGTGARGYIDPVNTTLVAFSVKDHGADAGEIAPTLRSGGHDKSHANGGVMPAIAFAQNSRDEVRLQGGDGQIIGALAAEPGMKQTTYISFRVNDHGADATEDQSPTLRRQGVQGVQAGMAVRRLTPQECERLQGFPDDYTLTPYRGKPAADGPRYKALGNSMAVPVMRWIGQRIAQVQAMP